MKKRLLGVLASVGLGCLVLAVMGPGGPKYVDTFGHLEANAKFRSVRGWRW